MRLRGGHLAWIFIGTIVIPLVALKWLPIPFAWASLSVASCSYALAAAAPGARRTILLGVGASCLAFGVAELALARVVPPPVVKHFQPDLHERDPILGWAPAPGRVSRSWAAAAGTTIYDVTYTIDSLGRRLSPAVESATEESCVLFFSDSYVFGEGVEDDETFPYLVGKLGAGAYRIVNLGAPAYGAEHMLAMLESRDWGPDRPCRVTHVVYVALPHHVLRAAGKTPYSIRGPRFALSPNGTPRYLGTQAPPTPRPRSRRLIRLRARVASQLQKSKVVGFVDDIRPRSTPDERELYFSIVRRSFELMSSIWPSAEKHVIAWDSHPFFAGGSESFHAGLSTVAARLHFIDQILPGYTDDPIPYGIHPLDLHPNAAAHARVADYVDRFIVG